MESVGGVDRPATDPASDQHAMLERARRVLPGGILHAWALPEDLTCVIARGAGSHVFAEDGREFIDFVLGSGPMILGHGHPAVRAAIERQLERGTGFYWLTEPAIALAERIVRDVPCAESVRFSTTGSEATFYALRLARAFTKRDRVLKFEGGFHGGHDYAQIGFAPRNAAYYPQGFPDSAGIPRVLESEVLVAPYNDVGLATDLIGRHADQLAAVIVEPVQRGIPPRPGFLQALREVTRRAGVVLIFDEIVTGFRLHRGGAQAYYGVEADVATLGKIIGGGLPLSAICGRADIMRLAGPDHRGKSTYVVQMGTFNGYPLAAAAGLATLDVLERDGAYERLHAAGRAIREGLDRILAKRGLPHRVIGEGPLFQVFFTDQEVYDYRSAQLADTALARRFDTELVRQGMFLNIGGRHYVSLAHSDDDIAELLAAAESSADKLLKSTSGRVRTDE